MLFYYFAEPKTFYSETWNPECQVILGQELNLAYYLLNFEAQLKNFVWRYVCFTWREIDFDRDAELVSLFDTSCFSLALSKTVDLNYELKCQVNFLFGVVCHVGVKDKFAKVNHDALVNGLIVVGVKNIPHRVQELSFCTNPLNVFWLGLGQDWKDCHHVEQMRHLFLS